MVATNPARLTAADVMRANPRTCSIYSSVLEAVLVLRDAHCTAVPILDNGKPVGLLTDRDVALALAEYGSNLSALPVSTLMSQGVVSVPPESSIDHVLERLGEEGVLRLLVVDADNQLLGIISLADLAPHVSTRDLGETVTEAIERA